MAIQFQPADPGPEPDAVALQQRRRAERVTADLERIFVGRSAAREAETALRLRRAVRAPPRKRRRIGWASIGGATAAACLGLAAGVVLAPNLTRQAPPRAPAPSRDTPMLAVLQAPTEPAGPPAPTVAAPPSPAAPAAPTAAVRPTARPAPAPTPTPTPPPRAKVATGPAEAPPVEAAATAPAGGLAAGDAPPVFAPANEEADALGAARDTFRRAYRRAERAGVPNGVLRAYREEWADLLDAEPRLSADEALEGYRTLTGDLAREVDEARARAAEARAARPALWPDLRRPWP
jgi:hypothetical protein